MTGRGCKIDIPAIDGTTTKMQLVIFFVQRQRRLVTSCNMFSCCLVSTRPLHRIVYLGLHGPASDRSAGVSRACQVISEPCLKGVSIGVIHLILYASRQSDGEGVREIGRMQCLFSMTYTAEASDPSQNTSAISITNTDANANDIA
jgi:hypothetical protein